LQRLIVPGLLGAAVLQINVVVSRFLAMAVDDSAVTLLYLSSRLVELPLGLFTAAAVTVLFPTLSSFATRGDKPGFVAEYSRGLRLIWAVAVPAAIGLVILREPIVDLLFRRGNFGMEDVGALGAVIAVMALAMPFYSLSVFATRGLHAFKDMKAPMRIAVWAFLSNLVFSLILMWPLGAVGLAAANLLSAMLQSYLLQRALARIDAPAFSRARFAPALTRIVAATLAMGVLVYGGWLIVAQLLGQGRLADVVAVALLIPIAAFFYLGLLCKSGFEDADLLKQILSRALRRRS